MSIGQAYSEVLSEQEQKALGIACDILINEAFNDLPLIEKPQDTENTHVGMYLPTRYLYKYTPLFFKKFAVCLITVAWKLAQKEPMPLASVAEELAAWVIVQEAKRLLDDEFEEATEEDNLEEFVDTLYEDLDFQFLYSDAHDGIEETHVGQQMGIFSLAFDGWFKPFSDEADYIVHPYTDAD